MLEKRPQSGSSVEVTFRMPPLDGVVELYLCGDFNNWHTSGMPLSQEPDGSWVTRIILDSGKSYRFRYHDNQGRWHNDWDADAYVPNAFGSEDSVVDLAAPLKNLGAEQQQAGARRRAGGRGDAAQRGQGSRTASHSGPGSGTGQRGRPFQPDGGPHRRGGNSGGGNSGSRRRGRGK
jgi:hypothetical protein